MATVSKKKSGTKSSASKSSASASKSAASKSSASKSSAPKSSASSAVSASKPAAPKSSVSASKPAASSAAPKTSAPWEGHVRWFGSEKAYAEAIKEKESKGIPLSDPAAAAAFKAAHPEYFRSIPIAEEEKRSTDSEFQSQWMSNMMQAIEGRLRELEQLSWPPQFLQFVPPERPAPAVPKVETAPEAVGIPAVAPPTPQPEQLPEGVHRGFGGFERTVVPKMTLPNEEELYRIYREVFGPETEERYVRQFLASPWFRRVLGGYVPMYMAADPLWRKYLRRLGLREAVERRLTGTG